MKYVVLKDFRDRFSGMRIFRKGDLHEPPNAERAQQLIKLGFIRPTQDDTRPPQLPAGPDDGAGAHEHSEAPSAEAGRNRSGGREVRRQRRSGSEAV